MNCNRAPDMMSYFTLLMFVMTSTGTPNTAQISLTQLSALATLARDGAMTPGALAEAMATRTGRGYALRPALLLLVAIVLLAVRARGGIAVSAIGIAAGGLVVTLICIWLLVQLSPENLLFGTGNLRVLLELPGALPFDAERFSRHETWIAAMGTLTIALMASLVLRRPRYLHVLILVAGAINGYLQVRAWRGLCWARLWSGPSRRVNRCDWFPAP